MTTTPEVEVMEEEEAGAADAGGWTMMDSIRTWFLEDAAWWLSSFLFHMVLMCVLAFIGTEVKPTIVGDAPSFTEAEQQEDMPEPNLDNFEVGQTPEEPTELTTETLTLNQAPPAMDASVETDPSGGGGMGIGEGVGLGVGEGGGTAMAANGPMLGGLGGFDVKAFGPGPAVRGAGGVGYGVGTGKNPGVGGSGVGFGGRGSGARKAMVGGFGGTKHSERAVAAALNWLARHQNRDGSWSLDGYKAQCKDATCTGETNHGKHDCGATAMGLLPFLAAGQTHESRGPYQRTIYNGLGWLINNQKKDGDLRGGANMYSHGLAAIALCEAYGMTGDKRIGAAAQQALNFIMAAQHPQTGGWRYNPGDEGDTSVVGWQLMALKSGYMAGLTVNSRTFDGVKRWLELVNAGGSSSAGFSYTPKGGATPTMTSVGLLCHQYLGAKRTDNLMINGSNYLMANTPEKSKNVYYWYYATQVMHNLAGPEWDTWNRKMRRTLIDSQSKDGCAAGSWSSEGDQWGRAGGRVMQTSFGALTIEVYYRYLPLYKLDKEEDVNAILAEPASEKKEPAKQ